MSYLRRLKGSFDRGFDRFADFTYRLKGKSWNYSEPLRDSITAARNFTGPTARFLSDLYFIKRAYDEFTGSSRRYSRPFKRYHSFRRANWYTPPAYNARKYFHAYRDYARRASSSVYRANRALSRRSSRLGNAGSGVSQPRILPNWQFLGPPPPPPSRGTSHRRLSKANRDYQKRLSSPALFGPPTPPPSLKTEL